MDLLSLVVMMVIPGAILVLYMTREPPIIQDFESLEVSKNLGDPTVPTKGRFLAWFLPLSLPIVVSEEKAPIVENVLIFEEYPLVPLRVISSWIEPGRCIDVIVYKDAQGKVLNISLAT